MMRSAATAIRARLWRRCGTHNHPVDFTVPNVYCGMAGFYLLFDDLDSGDEQDPTPQALHLPSYPYDYPLIFQAQRFDTHQRWAFDQCTPEGVPSDKVTVNSKIEPVLRVARRKDRPDSTGFSGKNSSP